MEETRLQTELDALTLQLKEYSKLLSAVQKASRVCSKAAEAGDIRRLESGLGQLNQSADDVHQVLSQLRWEFPMDEYFASGAWRSELVSALASEGVKANDEGRAVVAPPFEVTAESNSFHVLGKRLPTTSPVRIAQHLASELKKPPARDFVKSVYRAVRHLDTGRGSGLSAKLRDVFNVLTLSEEFRSEYPDERCFLVELLRMHQTPESERPRSMRYQFDTATSSVHPRDILQVRGPSGETLRFYKILFIKE